jgi:acetate CoA/acetoacetate CoA-transferase beta subunit
MEPQTLIARRIARELLPGMLVNLGIGIPSLVAKYLPAGMQVFFQSENGLPAFLPQRAWRIPC